MRVLLLSHFYPPETHGGTQAYVSWLARGLAAEGHAVEVIAGARDGGGATSTRVEAGGVRVHRIHRLLPDEAFAGDLPCHRIREEVTRLAREFRPDLVHLHHWHALSHGLVSLLAAGDTPVVVTLHDLFVSCPRFFRLPPEGSFCPPTTGFDVCARCVAADMGNPPLEALAASLDARFTGFLDELDRAAAVLTVSDFQKRTLEALPRFPRGLLQVVPLGIPDLTPKPQASHDDHVLRIVHWAGLDLRKGPQVLLDAVRQARDPGRIQVRFHGREGDEDFMQKMRARAEGLHVEFLGAFEDEDLPAIAAWGDVAVFPFLAYETYGLVVDEALTLGLPVLVSDRGAPPERLGSRGLTFDAADAASLTAHLDTLAADRPRLTALSRAPHGARPFSAHFARLLELYAQQ